MLWSLWSLYVETFCLWEFSSPVWRQGSEFPDRSCRGHFWTEKGAVINQFSLIYILLLVPVVLKTEWLFLDETASYLKRQCCFGHSSTLHDNSKLFVHLGYSFGPSVTSFSETLQLSIILTLIWLHLVFRMSQWETTGHSCFGIEKSSYCYYSGVLGITWSVHFSYMQLLTAVFSWMPEQQQSWAPFTSYLFSK